MPLTIKDIKKIERHGFKKKEFIIMGEYDRIDFEDQERWWKESIISTKRKFFRVNVAHDANGKCFFLKKKEGCMLGKDRPTICHIFPFWVEEKTGKVTYEPPDNDFCCMEKQRIPANLAVKLMGETEESIKHYFYAIKEDCLKNKEKHYLILRKLFPERFD